MRSNIFYSNYRKRVEQSVKHLLNNHEQFLSPQTALGLCFFANLSILSCPSDDVSLSKPKACA